MSKINMLLEKFPSILEKINKYTNMSLTMENVKLLIIFSIISLILLFLYFDKTSSYTKDNFIKWDNFSFLKLSIYMIIPILSLIGLNTNLFNNEILNNWVHFFLIFFIIPIFPYLILCSYRILFLCINSIIKKIRRNIKHRKRQAEI